MRKLYCIIGISEMCVPDGKSALQITSKRNAHCFELAHVRRPSQHIMTQRH